MIDNSFGSRTTSSELEQNARPPMANVLLSFYNMIFHNSFGSTTTSSEVQNSRPPVANVLLSFYNMIHNIFGSRTTSSEEQNSCPQFASSPQHASFHSSASFQSMSSNQLATSASCDPETGTAGTMASKTDNHLNMAAVTVLAMTFGWLCGFTFSPAGTKQARKQVPELFIVIITINLVSVCTCLVAFLLSRRYPIAARAMKAIVIGMGILSSVLAAWMILSY